MQRYKVSFEDVGYTADRDDLGRELDEAAVASLNARMRSGDKLPDGFVGISAVRISADDQDFTDGEYKAWFEVTLLVEADSPAEVARLFFAHASGLQGLLDAAADELDPSLGREEDWDLTDVDEVDPHAAPALSG